MLKGSEFTFQYLDGSPLVKTLLVANFKFLTDDMRVMEQIDLRARWLSCSLSIAQFQLVSGYITNQATLLQYKKENLSYS